MRYVVIALIVLTSNANAQSFPVDTLWRPLLCGDINMNDKLGDEPGAIDERDIVGDRVAPAGMHAADQEFLFLRMRVDKDPSPAAAFRPFSWGYLIDVDAILTTYEILVLVDGTGGGQAEVKVFRNTTTTTPNDPTDPADTPPVQMFAASTHARSRIASGSQYGGGDDFWLEAAVPWSTLMPLGMSPTTPIRVWAASSSTANSLNGDFACHDGATGEPTLDVIVSDPTTGNPIVDTDGDGFSDAEEVAAGSDPNNPNSVPQANSRLEGGGGCSAGVQLGWTASTLLGLLAIGLVRARRRRARDSTR